MTTHRLNMTAALLIATPLAAHAQTPWEDHGALRVSPNGRQLQHADGTPFFYLADTAWEIATRMQFDAQTGHGRGIESYLDQRAAQGFNVIQAPVIAPLTGLGNNVEGQRITGGGAFNPDALNEAYLQRVDRVLDEAEARGLYVALLPTWGSLVTGGTINAANAERYGEVIGTRYADRKNIIWTLGGDIAPGWENVWNAMAKGVANGVNGAPGATPDFSTTLMTFHPAGGRSSSQFTNLGSWMDFNSLQTSHSDPKVPESATYNRHFDRPAADYALSPPKPMINTEPPYENITIGLSSNPSAPRHGPYELRLAGYWSVLGGAAGHTYGHNNVWQAHDFDHGYSPQFGANDEWEDSLDTPGAAQASLMKSLVLSRPFGELVRDNVVLANYASLATGKTVSSSVASRGDDYALAYSANGSTLNVAMGKIAGANVKAWWFNPRTGAASEIGVFANTGTQSFDPAGAPGHDNDWVLVLSDALADHPAPGQAMDQTAFRKLHEDFAYLHRYTAAKTAGSVAASSGAVTFNTGVTNSSRRAVLGTHRRDFDFFGQVIDVQLNGLTLGGAPGAGGNALFLAIGEGDGSGNPLKLWPSAELGDGIAFEVQRVAAGYRLAFLEVVAGVATSQHFTLGAMPADLQVLIDGDGKAWQVIATGSGFAGGRQIIEGTWANLDADDLAFYQLAIGACNYGAVATPTTASIGELIVAHVVPEPVTAAALGSGMMVLASRHRPSRPHR